MTKWFRWRGGWYEYGRFSDMMLAVCLLICGSIERCITAIGDVNTDNRTAPVWDPP